MAVDIPNWLTKQYIQNALQHEKDYSVTIQDLRVDMAVPKGNNYVCNVYRVTVQYSKSNDMDQMVETSLIIKEPIYGPMYDSIMKFVIENEMKFYNILAPKLDSIFGADGDSEENEILPKSYFSSEQNIIIMEDMKPKGYVMSDRRKRFDYAHSVIALKALAKFHAGTKIIIDKEPSIIKVFNLTFDKEETKNKLGTLFMANFKNLADEFKKLPHLEKYTDWLYKNYEIGLDKGFKLMDPKEDEFNVLIHGDFGLQNLLVKYSDDVPIKLMPIDYQNCRYTSPVIDFFYFIDFNVQEDIRNNKFDELVHLYVTEVNCNLEKYGGTTRLDESDFRKYIEERSYLRVFLNVGFLSVTCAAANPDETEIYKLDDFVDNEVRKLETNAFSSYVKNQEFIKLITERFNEYEKNGLVTVNE